MNDLMNDQMNGPMNDNDALAQDQKRYLQVLGDNSGYANAQTELLSALSLHHGHAIGTSQAEYARASAAALQDIMPKLFTPGVAGALSEYATDFGQRWILFLETLCRRGDACILREKEGFKPVLAFGYDVVVDGRKLDRAVNYALVRIHAPAGTQPPRDDARPWVIIDPRAGHGSGIGGFKSDSEVGVALTRRASGLFRHLLPRIPSPSKRSRTCARPRRSFCSEVHARHPRMRRSRWSPAIARAAGRR